MKLDAFELRRIELPLVEPFRTSFGTTHRKEAVLVRVVGPSSEGWGECVAMTRPIYSPEYLDGAIHVMAKVLIPLLLEAGEISAAEVSERLSAIKGHPMSKACLEMAILDAELRAAHRSLASFFGATRTRVPSGVSIGITESVPALLEAVGRFVDAGYVRIKLKIQPGWDVEPVRAVREQFGDQLVLQVDANTAYTPADARLLAQLDAFDLLMIEQPLAEDDIQGHVRLARALKTPICLDESITSARSAAEAIAVGACSVINIKAGRVGGYLEARRISTVAAAHGVPVWCGGMLETGLGRAANAALAACPEFTITGDISASDRFYQQDITKPFVIQDGHVSVPQGSGLGVDVEQDHLESVTTWVQTLRA